MPRRKVMAAKSKLRPGRWRHILKECPRCHKDWYTSYAQAQRMVLKAANERDTVLYIYRCPGDRDKYHLTRQEQHDGRGDVL